MATATPARARRLPDPTIERIKSILEVIRLEGHQWVKSIPTGDWRRIRYFGDPRAAVRAGFAVTGQDIGPPAAELLADRHGLNRYLADDPSTLTESAHHYILVKADKQCVEDNAIAFVRPVSKIDLRGDPLLNFHVWFHTVAPAGREREHQVMFGLRLEGPEGDDTHDYYHAQPLTKFGSQAALQGISEHFSTRFPTIPLNASDAVELCLNAVLIACGKDTLRNMMRSTGDADLRAAATNFWTKMFGPPVQGRR